VERSGRAKQLLPARDIENPVNQAFELIEIGNGLDRRPGRRVRLTEPATA
jgi:hypothetical protein